MATIPELLRIEANASEELDPTDSSIQVMRDAASMLEGFMQDLGDEDMNIAAAPLHLYKLFMRYKDLVARLKGELDTVCVLSPIAHAPIDGTMLLLYLGKSHDRTYPLGENEHLYCLGSWGGTCWLSTETEDHGRMGSEMTGWMEDVSRIEVVPTQFMYLPKGRPNP